MPITNLKGVYCTHTSTWTIDCLVASEFTFSSFSFFALGLISVREVSTTPMTSYLRCPCSPWDPTWARRSFSGHCYPGLTSTHGGRILLLPRNLQLIVSHICSSRQIGLRRLRVLHYLRTAYHAPTGYLYGRQTSTSGSSLKYLDRHDIGTIRPSATTPRSHACPFRSSNAFYLASQVPQVPGSFGFRGPRRCPDTATFHRPGQSHQNRVLTAILRSTHMSSDWGHDSLGIRLCNRDDGAFSTRRASYGLLPCVVDQGLNPSVFIPQAQQTSLLLR